MPTNTGPLPAARASTLTRAAPRTSETSAVSSMDAVSETRADVGVARRWWAVVIVPSDPKIAKTATPASAMTAPTAAAPAPRPIAHRRPAERRGPVGATKVGAGLGGAVVLMV